MYGTLMEATGIKDIGDGNIRVTLTAVNPDENAVISFNTTEGARDSFEPDMVETEMPDPEDENATVMVENPVYKKFRVSVEAA